MKKLSKDEMKKVIGGVAMPGDNCTKNADCGAGQICSFLLGYPGRCIPVDRGIDCMSDADCGNGTHCVPKPVGSGKWCN